MTNRSRRSVARRKAQLWANAPWAIEIRPVGAEPATTRVRDEQTRNPKSEIRNLRSRGFTLLEILVALSLSLFLLSAIYAGLRLYYRFSTTGQEDVERALLARAVLRRIELDVRSVMYRAATPATAAASTTSSTTASTTSSNGSGGSASSGSTGSGSTGSGSSSSGASGSSSSSSSTTSSTPPDDAYNTSSTGLYGNMTTLLMHVSKPGHEDLAVTLASVGNMQTRTSDMATVAYFVTGTATGILQHAITMPGLARLEGDRLALAMADSESSVALMAAKTEILASEVDAIKFTYFDGFRWRYDWDSNILGGMPKAIEVLVELRPLPGRTNRSGSSGSSSSVPNVYRLLIAIPLAKPIDTSLITTQ